MPDVAASLSRRDLVRVGATSTLAALASGLMPAAAAPSHVFASDPLHTPLCDLLGIRIPVLQAPMFRVVTPEMIAAVGAAGGLGILPATGVPPEEVRRQIRRIRELTDRPFGVNLILHPDVTRPMDSDAIPEQTIRNVQTVLNRFRERLGLAATFARPPRLPPIADAAFEVILEERVPVFSIGVGKPTAELVARCHAQGTKVMSMIATVPDALEVARLGVDAIVAQGGEAGGHRSTWIKRPSAEMATIGTLALVPQVVDAVRVPVVAAGGVMDGRGLAAVLVLGGTGVLMGTRFIATRESAAPEFYKRALIERDGDATTLTDAFTGLWARVLRTTYTEEYRASGAPVLPLHQQTISGDVTMAAAQRGDGEYYPMYAGQGLGLIRDVPPAAEVVRRVAEDARRRLATITNLGR